MSSPKKKSGLTNLLPPVKSLFADRMHTEETVITVPPNSHAFTSTLRLVSPRGFLDIRNAMHSDFNTSLQVSINPELLLFAQRTLNAYASHLPDSPQLPSTTGEERMNRVASEFSLAQKTNNSKSPQLVSSETMKSN